MSDGMARGNLGGNILEMSSAREQVYCEKCGSDKVCRVFREGFLEEKIYSLFGYYPWRCRYCGLRTKLRKRGKVKRRDFPEEARNS